MWRMPLSCNSDSWKLWSLSGVLCKLPNLRKYDYLVILVFCFFNNKELGVNHVKARVKLFRDIVMEVTPTREAVRDEY
jgi:hypothetical protein